MAVASTEPRLNGPKTARQQELYEILVLLHTKQISALESQSRINMWVNKHAGGDTFKMKQVIPCIRMCCLADGLVSYKVP